MKKYAASGNPQKTRTYEATIEEQCDATYNNSCKMAIVTVKSKSANEAIKKALEKAKNELVDLSDSIFVGTVRCIDRLIL